MVHDTFWHNKPVMKQNHIQLSNLSEYDDTNDDDQSIYWSIIKLSDVDSVAIVCDFLNKYYREKNNMCFTVDLLQFDIGKDGEIIAMINKKNNGVCGVVCVGFKNLIFFNKIDKFAHVNFVCVHPSLRKKGITETLMNKTISHVNTKHKIQKGYYTPNTKIHQQYATIRTYLRPLNYSKLHDSEFLFIDQKKSTVHKNLMINDLEDNLNYVPMNLSHFNKVCELYNYYVSLFNVAVKYSNEELLNLLLNTNIVKSYVIVDDNNNVTDFVSYCHIQYSGKIM